MMFFGKKNPEVSPPTDSSSSAVHENAGSHVADMDMWSAHTLQLNDLVGRVQQQHQAEKDAMQLERAALDDRWLQMLRSSRLESAWMSLIGTGESRGQMALFRRWVDVATLIRSDNAERQGKRVNALQLRLQDGGRTDLLRVC